MVNAKELKGRLERERQAQSDRRRPRFSAGLKQAVVRYVLASRARGATEAQLLKELGIGPATLIRWCGRKDEDVKFRQMSIVRKTKEPAVAIEPAAALPALMARRGAVAIIGLSVSELAELLERLGC
jgi:transposase-like protein